MQVSRLTLPCAQVKKDGQVIQELSLSQKSMYTVHGSAWGCMGVYELSLSQKSDVYGAIPVCTRYLPSLCTPHLVPSLCTPHLGLIAVCIHFGLYMVLILVYSRALLSSAVLCSRCVSSRPTRNRSLILGTRLCLRPCLPSPKPTPP